MKCVILILVIKCVTVFFYPRPSDSFIDSSLLETVTEQEQNGSNGNSHWVSVFSELNIKNFGVYLMTPVCLCVLGDMSFDFVG